METGNSGIIYEDYDGKSDELLYKGVM